MRRQIRQAWCRLIGPKAFANSFPKSGTYLLRRCLSLLPGLVPEWYDHVDRHTEDLQAKLRAIQKGQFLSGHLAWSSELSELLRLAGVRPFFVIRDLRDIAVSHSFYVANINRSHRLSAYYHSLASDEERLLASIEGVAPEHLADNCRFKSLGEHVADYMPWLDDPTCLTIRFEDLIGKSGGGSEDRQAETLRQIVHHLGLRVPDRQLARIVGRVFDRSSTTFRKGQIGDWRRHFDERHREVFKRTANTHLVRLGYADCDSW